MQKTTLGDFELTMLTDGGYYLDGGAMFGVVPKVLWSKKAQPDDLNRLRLGLSGSLCSDAEGKRGGKTFQ